MTRPSSGGFRRLSDILESGLPPLAWLAEPIFTTDALGMIGAPPKCFKSWMLADLVVSTVTGVPWLRTFPVSRAGPVLLVSPEGGVRGLARRIEAILSPLDWQMRDLDIAFVRTRGLSLTESRDVADLHAACASERPVLICYDSVYAGLASVRTSQLSESGAAFRSLSDAASEHEAAVVTTHHLNAREGTGLDRLTGAGAAEWASAALIGTRGSRLGDAGTTTAVVHWSLTARDVPELAFTTTFSVGATDPTNLASPLNYGISVAFDGGEASADLSWVEHRVLDAVSMYGDAGCSVREINDVLAREGKPFKESTIREALDQLVQKGRVDGADSRWWATSPAKQEPH
jgi:hypothetical protein